MSKKSLIIAGVLLALSVLLTVSIQSSAQGSAVTLLNVSYDPTRELYRVR